MTALAQRLLVVDDEPDFCANLVDVFGDRGYCVDVAYDGCQALALAQRNVYAVALLDYRMPGMNGVELCRELQRISTATRAILLSAHVTQQISDDARSAGAMQSLSKPIDLDRLVPMVERASTLAP